MPTVLRRLRDFLSDENIASAGPVGDKLIADAESDLEQALEGLAHIVAQAKVNAVGGDDGFIARYDMPVGSIHRAMGFIQDRGYAVTEHGYIHRPRFRVVRSNDE